MWILLPLGLLAWLAFRPAGYTYRELTAEEKTPTLKATLSEIQGTSIAQKLIAQGKDVAFSVNQRRFILRPTPSGLVLLTSDPLGAPLV